MEGIKCWMPDERPRERMINHGKRSLSDAELLAIILGSGAGEKNALDLGREILKVSGGISGLKRFEVSDLCKIKGIGNAKATGILASVELASRIKVEKTDEFIRSSSDAFKHFAWLGDLDHEEFHVIFLNRANSVISKQCISKGGMSGTVADGKIIFKKALDLKSHALILVHNHPSGQLKPSTADLQLTKRLKEFGGYIDLEVLDHIIISNTGYYSFSDEAMI